MIRSEAVVKTLGLLKPAKKKGAKKGALDFASIFLVVLENAKKFSKLGKSKAPRNLVLKTKPSFKEKLAFPITKREKILKLQGKTKLEKVVVDTDLKQTKQRENSTTGLISKHLIINTKKPGVHLKKQESQKNLGKTILGKTQYRKEEPGENRYEKIREKEVSSLGEHLDKPLDKTLGKSLKGKRVFLGENRAIKDTPKAPDGTSDLKLSLSRQSPSYKEALNLDARPQNAEKPHKGLSKVGLKTTDFRKNSEKAAPSGPEKVGGSTQNLSGEIHFESGDKSFETSRKKAERVVEKMEKPPGAKEEDLVKVHEGKVGKMEVLKESSSFVEKGKQKGVSEESKVRLEGGEPQTPKVEHAGQKAEQVVQGRELPGKVFEVVSALYEGRKEQGRLVFKLHPPELGKVKLEVKVKGKEVKLRFEMETAHGKEFIENNFSSFKNIMEKEGFNLSEFLVLGGGGGSSNMQGEGSWEKGSDKGRARGVHLGSDAPDGAEETKREFFKGISRISIRV